MYREIIIETFRNPGEPAAESIRARPLPGQGLDTSMRVECSSKMREKHPDAILKIRAKVTDREDGKKFLYCHYSWPYQVLTSEEAQKIINENNR